MARLESRAAFGRLAGVSAMAISKACKPGKALELACVGPRIDLDHPAAAAYLAGKGQTPTADRPAVPKQAKSTPVAPTPPSRRQAARASAPADARPLAPESPSDLDAVDIASLAHLSLDELTRRYGTELRLKDWLDARKKIEDVREKELKNAETQGLLIERDLVSTHLFGAFEALHLRLLSDSPKTIARRLYAACGSNVSIEEAESLVRELISAQLRPLKTEIARKLRNG